MNPLNEIIDPLYDDSDTVIDEDTHLTFSPDDSEDDILVHSDSDDEDVELAEDRIFQDLEVAVNHYLTVYSAEDLADFIENILDNRA